MSIEVGLANIGFSHDVEFHTELVVEDHCEGSDE